MSKLGKGLSALIPDKEVHAQYAKNRANTLVATEKKINIDLIAPNSQQPRKVFDKAKLQELANSISEHGLIQPLVVRKVDKGFELIAGERRLRASKIAGLKEVPVILKDELDEKAKLEIALIENIQREDLNVVEEAEAYKKLQKEFSLTQEQIAERTGKSRSAVANKLRLLSLPEEILKGLQTKMLAEGHARALLPLIKEPKKLMTAYHNLLDTKSTVREVEVKAKQKFTKAPIVDPEVKKIKDDLEEKLATKVSIKDQGKKGNISLNYFSREDLKRIRDKICNLP